MATFVQKLYLAEIAEPFPFMDLEYRVYSAKTGGSEFTLTAGIADAVTLAEDGRLDTVIDWKSDVSPTTLQIEDYREQISDYLKGCGARRAMLVFVTAGRIVEIQNSR